MSNKKRLIDPNDVYKLFDKRGLANLHVGDIDTIRRVDAVEVVRCKDCKHYKPQNKSAHWNHTVPYCMRSGVSIKTNPDDFCSYGERKTDQHTLKDGDTNELEVRSN